MPADYGNYTRQEFGKYVDDMIGDYSAQLEKNTFNDGRHTPYLEAVKYGADIVWYMYNTKQDQDLKLARRRRSLELHISEFLEILWIPRNYMNS